MNTASEGMKLTGYIRPDGRVGFRNHLLVVPIAGCSKETARRIAEKVDGAIVLDHAFGCEIGPKQLDDMATQLRGLVTHPNVGGVLFLLMGCAQTLSLKLPETAKEGGKLVEAFNVQRVGGTDTCVRKGVEILQGMAKKLQAQERVPVAPESLVTGLKCGASDKTSFSELHPIVGLAVGRLVDAGATVALGEIWELIPCPEDIAARAKDPEVAQAIKESIAGWKADSERIFEGEISVDEKAHAASLGHAAKAGSRSFQKVIGWRE